MAEEKSPPYDIEAEEAVIGSLLIDPDAILKIAPSLKPEDFFSETNRVIYQACISLYQRPNEVVNQITVAHELARQNRLEEIGGAAYLSHLISIVPTSLHIEHYAQIVSNAAVMRRLIAAAGQIAAIGYEAGPDVESSLNDAEDILFKVRARQGLRGLVPIREVLGEYFEEQLAEIPNPHVKEVRGKGLLIGVELKVEAGGARRFCEELMRKGILAKETHQHVIRFAPPLVIEKSEIDWAIPKIRDVLNMP